MNTRHVESFLRVVQLGSISQAAVAAGLSQPVVSRHIQDLEASLTIALLHRDGHGVSLTEAGRRILPFLQQVADTTTQAEEAAEAACRSASGLGRVAIALPPTLIRTLAAPLTRAILAEAPDAQIRLIDAFSGTLAEWLAEGRVDLAILYASGVSARVQAEPLLTEQLHLVTAPGGDLPARIAFDDLSTCRLILPSKAHGLRRTVEAAASARPGARLRVRIEADSFAAIVELVAAGFGSTILPATAIAGEIRAGRLVAIPIADPGLERSLFLATARNAEISQGTRRLVQIVKRLMRGFDA